MHALAILLAAAAVLLMIVAVAGMVTGRPGARAGLFLRVAAVACFIAAVVLNTVAH